MPPVSAARSTITLPGFMPATIAALMIFGAGRPGHGRGADDDVDGLQVFAEAALLLGALLLGELARVAALARGADAEVEELAAERFDLLARLRAHVEAFDLRAQPRAVAIACRPATPAPTTSTFDGRIVPAAVVSIGKKRGASCAAISTAL